MGRQLEDEQALGGEHANELADIGADRVPPGQVLEDEARVDHVE